ncbi:MAG: AraC family transcriptional regulator, partial [Acidobacteria bacterium]|nr:AraC family transcriptional regulator [Acidobacteriota bacterium]
MTIVLKPRFFRPRSTDQPGALGKFSFIIHEKSQQHYWSGAGCLSVKSFSGGEALYNVGRGRFRVDQDSYLILNQGQPYEIKVDAEKSFESFCVFFEDGFAEEVYYSLTVPTTMLLDNPDSTRQSSIYYFEKNYPHDDILSPALCRLKASLPNNKDDEVWINQQLHEIIHRLLRVQRRVYREIESLPAMRATTREELYRRLHRAKDFITASFDQPLSIDDMARVACLSPNHFLRTFQQAFHQTPHQFLTGKRLERAQRLLLRTDLTVTDICLTVGFESLGSFSSLFRRKLGVSPDKYRKKGDFG